MRLLKLSVYCDYDMSYKARIVFKVNGDIKSYFIDGYIENELNECNRLIEWIKEYIKSMISAGDKIEDVYAKDLGIHGVKEEYIELK
jgi:hypothetical protein